MHSKHFRRSADVAFGAADRANVTFLLGGLTWKHEELIAAVLRGHGHPAEALPQPDREAHEIGKEYCSSGLCNPAYFVCGTLIRRLRELEASGLSRDEIVREYAFLTAGSCGPCRFGMYEAEFRSALDAAGYAGFRVALFLQDGGLKGSTDAGLPFSVDFGFSVLHAFLLGDLINDLHRKLRAHEMAPGQADRRIRAVVTRLVAYFENPRYPDLIGVAPPWLRASLQRHRENRWFRYANTIYKTYCHLYGAQLTTELRKCWEEILTLRVDRLRSKPVVKVIGEFWAQLTEGDGNFRLFEFLENEGAEVHVEPISCWVLYLLHQAKCRLKTEYEIIVHEERWWSRFSRISEQVLIGGKYALYSACESLYRRHYSRCSKYLGEYSDPLLPQSLLAETAHPYYSSRLRGGEGHLEVAKNLYYTRERRSHMVVSVKPFGCMPSMQSDAVQAGLMDEIPEMMFAAIETSGEGEIHAHSRIQMALGDAKYDAEREFQRALSQTHRSLDELRSFVESRPELQSPKYKVSHRPGVISTAANFVLDLGEILDKWASPEQDERPRATTGSEFHRAVLRRRRQS